MYVSINCSTEINEMVGSEKTESTELQEQNMETSSLTREVSGPHLDTSTSTREVSGPHLDISTSTREVSGPHLGTSSSTREVSGPPDPDQALVFTPPDGGYGWVVVVAACVANIWIVGFVKSYSLVYVEILAAYPESSAYHASFIQAMLTTIGLLICKLFYQLHINNFIS